VVVAFFAGLFLGMIPTVRYPEGLFGFAIALFVLNSVYEDRKSVIAAITGALIPVGALMVRNHYAFGGFWKTGYSLTNEQTGFAWSYFVAHGPQYLQNILGEGVGVFAALGVFGMALLCAQHSTRRYGLLLTGLVLPTTLLYMAYYFMMGDGVVSLRFLLPTFYLYVIAGMWGLKLMRDAMGQSVYVGVAAVMVVTVFWGYPQSAQTLARLEKTNGVLAAISQTVQEQVKSGEVVIAPGGIQQHLNFVGNWRLIESSIFLEPRDMSRMVDRFGGSDMPNPMGHAVGRREAQAQYWDETMYGPSSRLFEDLNTWAGGAVYWVGTYEEMMAHVPTSDSLQVVAKIELPRVEDAESRRGRGRRGGGMPDGFRGGPPAGGRGGPMPAFSGNENLLLAKWIPHSAGS
ncbi:MAG: hypothetical protein QGG64_12255, partial [Candidatus Latescibacteria bacterium]|nr:hypothetical protein [Candidatus Latescibacterota bacterium]